MKTWWLVLILMLLESCSKDLELIKDDPNATFETLWEDFDRYYAQFAHKQIDWSAAFERHQNLIKKDMSDPELFQVLSSLLETLQDDHIALEAPPFYFKYQKKHEHRPDNFDPALISRYVTLNSSRTPFLYGGVGADLGYVQITTFGEELVAYYEIDKILTSFKDREGLIIDLRNNFGGSEIAAQIIASRFCREPSVYNLKYVRNGPLYEDFGKPAQQIIQPEGASFTKKIVVLTNKNVASAAEDFIFMAKAIPQCTVIGDTTSGSFGGCPIWRELPNGWLYRMPTCVQLSPDGEYFGVEGIPPDILQWDEDEADRKDPLLEKAIDYLME